MNYITLILLALGLSADAFAVSLTNGICSCRVNKKHMLLTGVIFGAFQGFMPILGYLLGNAFSVFASHFQHWIALFLLGSIGTNMIIDSVKARKNPDSPCSTLNLFTVKNLSIQGIATSIDALAAGISLAVLEFNIAASALLIGLITCAVCIIGVYIGRKFGSILGMQARLIGGGILIILGIKIFLENQF